MTRGKIIYIDKDERIYSTIEFNGDMYPEGNGDQIIERFESGSLISRNQYEEFVKRFNKRNYGYTEALIETVCTSTDRRLDIGDNWTDYLYIINDSERRWIINGKSERTLIEPNCLGIIHFQKVEKVIHRIIHVDSRPLSYDLTKKEFVKIMNRLRDSSDLVNKVDELFINSRDNVECDFCNGAGLQISHESIVVQLLSKIMRDNSDDIGYFIYELDYGRKYEPGMITDENGKDIDIGTTEKLYEYLSKA